MSNDSPSQFEMQFLTFPKFQMGVIYIKEFLQVWNRITQRVLIIYTQSSSNINDLHFDSFSLELVLQLIYPLTQGDEVIHFQNLAADMEMQPLE